MLEHIPTRSRSLPESAQRDLLLSLVALKYTQSNSICFAFDGQCIGVGAGQQSRIHCTRLAAQKAALWNLRQHPTTLNLPWKKGDNSKVKVNTINRFLRDDATPA